MLHRRRLRPARVQPIALAALVLAGCFRTEPPEPDACTPEVTEYGPSEGGHSDFCVDLTWNSKPPNAGTHFSVHAEFKTYKDSVPYGYLVHSMEHGGVVIGYNCPAPCPDEVALAQAWIESWPDDAPHPDCSRIRCHPQPKRRFILAPDPRLPMRWAASAWGSTWTSCRLDTASLGAYARSHYHKGPEDILGEDGVDFSAKGWCPNPYLDSIPGGAPPQ